VQGSGVFGRSATFFSDGYQGLGTQALFGTTVRMVMAGFDGFYGNGHIGHARLGKEVVGLDSPSGKIEYESAQQGYNACILEYFCVQ